MNNFESTLMRNLENLAALSEKNGLIEIKPFKNWKSSKFWAEAIFKLRLCNAGEVLEISEYASQFPEDARERAIKIETVARSLYEINGITIGSPDEILKYNNNHNTSLTRIEFLRNWVKDLEQIVVDTLYNIYISLQLKQMRLLINQVECAACGNIYEKTNLHQETKWVLYSTSEIICKNCLDEGINLDEFDILTYKCKICKEEFKTSEELNQHTCTAEKRTENNI
jgi:predicted Zn-ribbon and HTH transcriptional regulator